MVWWRRIYALLLIVPAVIGFPQAINLPQVDNSSPEEVNGLTHSHFPRSISSNTINLNNVEDTIKEVEEMLKTDLNLPRLTRGEILDILDNISKADSQARNPKAIMVVKPYTPEVSNENHMEDLYTKPPVTQIVGSDMQKPESETVSFRNTSLKRRGSKPATTSTTEGNPLEESPSSTYRAVSTTSKLRRRRPTRAPMNYDKKTTTEHTDGTSKPTTIRPLRRRRPILTTESVTTYHPSRRPVRRKSTTPRYPNHKYPDNEVSTEKENVLSENGLRIIDPPKFSPNKINYDFELMQAQENLKNEVSVDATLAENKESPKPLSTVEPSIEIQIPDHLRGVVADLNLDALRDPEKFAAKTDVSDSSEADRIKGIFASIGIEQASTRKSTTTTTTTAAPDGSSVADSISPEMRDLLITFGLLPNPNPKEVVSQTEEKYVPETAETNPEAYKGFKRLPEDKNSRSEMEEMLSRFGLGRGARKIKASENKPLEDVNNINIDIVPDQYQHIIKEMGFGERTSRRIRANKEEKSSDKNNYEYATKEEIEKLKKLTSAIKELEKLNRTITSDDLETINVSDLKELLSSLNQETSILKTNQALDPLVSSPSVTKNEIKRQEPTLAPQTTSLSTIEEENKTPSLEDLEDSFGGKKETVTETPVPETTPARKTGFYYLVDWNTFFDIDDTKGKRVNLRFQPTIGDPKRFLSVHVP